MPGAARTAGGLVKTGGLSFEPEEIERIERIQQIRHSSFSDAVRFLVRQGLTHVEHAQREGKLVA